MVEFKKNISYRDVFPGEVTECDREQEVYQYFEQLLSGNDAEKLEQHIKTCSVCAKLLAELDETNEAAQLTSIDARKAEQIFDQTRLKLEDRLKGSSETGPTRRIHVPVPSRSFNFPAYLNVLLIGLVAVLIYPTYRSFVLDEQVSDLNRELDAERVKGQNVGNQDAIKESYEKQIQSLSEERNRLLQPGLSGSSVYSVRTERDVTAQEIQILFGEKQKTYDLVFSVPAGEYNAFLVEIWDNGKSIWNNEIAVSNPAGATSALISLNLKEEYFPKTSYRLRIHGKSGKGPVLLNEFKMKIIRAQ